MKYLNLSGLSYFLNKIKTYLTSSTYLNSIGISNSDIDDIADDAGYSSGSLPASEDIFITGDIIPNTDNSVDLGASSKNIKMIYTKGITINGTQFLPSNYAQVSHTHTKSDITDFPTLATVATSGSYNDLTNKPTTMTPTSHTHGNITNDGKIGSNANKPLITTTGGTVTTGSFGTSANTFCEGNDSRLSDARTPTSHTHTKSEITDFPTLATVATSGSYNDLSNKPTIPTVNNATLTIQKNGTNVQTFTANQSTNATANITVPTKTSDLTNDSGFITSDNTKIPLAGSNQISGSLIPATDNSIDIGSSTKNIKMLYTKGITIDGAQFLPSDYLPKTTALESLSTNSIPFHNSYPRCKYLGTSITDAQNTAIKNRTYADLFIGDYWTINGVNWRIVAIDYYYNVGDTNFDKGNVIVMPDTVLYNAQMNSTDTTAGAYYGSLMRTQNLNSARTIAQNAFGSHLANHRILLANSVDNSGPNNWAWCDSDGVELPNEVQIYGTRAWGSALKGFDVATQKQQFPLMALAPQFVNTRQNYWLQDVSSGSVSGLFAVVYLGGHAGHYYASDSLGVRPSITLSFI